MRLRILAGAGTGLLASACAGGPQAGLDAAVIACGDTLAQNAAYVRQHVEAREEKLKVIRFASEEAMDAYNEVTDTFTVLGIDLVAMRNVIEKEHGLSDATTTYTFDHTTDEEANARIEAAKACAGSLLE